MAQMGTMGTMGQHTGQAVAQAWQEQTADLSLWRQRTSPWSPGSSAPLTGTALATLPTSSGAQAALSRHARSEHATIMHWCQALLCSFTYLCMPEENLVLQGMTGCQQMQWRNQTGGYLREILTAKVYDVAVRALPPPAPPESTTTECCCIPFCSSTTRLER